MVDSFMMASSAQFSDSQYRYPVNTPIYQYLVCDLLTDQLQGVLPLVGVTMDRRVSRVGELKGQWLISNRNQALLADSVSKNSGRYAIWALRNKRLWWGGILWSAKGSVTSRSYDTVDIQASTFDSYPYQRNLDNDWPPETMITSAQKILDIWNFLQATNAASNIGMLTDAGIANVSEVYPQWFIESELTSYGDMIQAYTDSNPGCDYTVDVYQQSGLRKKRVRTAGNFALVNIESRLVISGYKLPAWTFSRASGANTFRAWGDPGENNIGEAQQPVSSVTYQADDLLAAGWPQLDMSVNVGAIPPVGGVALVLNNYARALRDRYSGVRDIVSYEVDLSTSEWHPNLIGQNVAIKHSQKDLWRPGQKSVIRPVVAEFTAPDRGQPERVKFTIDGAEEDAT